MKLVRVLTLVAAMVVVGGISKPAEASEGFSFGYYGPGYAFFPGHYPRHIFYPHLYKPYHYFHYGPGYKARYNPRQKASHSKKSKKGDRCSRWSQACTNSWGKSNPNYQGCMRYHRCG